jgi:hypothetical protein
MTKNSTPSRRSTANNTATTTDESVAHRTTRPRAAAPIVVTSAAPHGVVVASADFYGTTIDVLGVEAGGGTRHYVAIRPICDTLDVTIQGQLAKLKEESWAVVKEIFTTGADGKTYEMSCLNIEALPMWLCSIKAGKVKPDARPALIRFQCECAAVLYRAVFDRPATSALPANDNGVEARLALLERRIADMSSNGKPENGVIGARKARVWVTGPIMHYARIMAPLLGQSVQSVRLEADKAVRKAVGFPLALGWAWEVLPENKLGDVTAEVTSLTARAGKRFKRACAAQALAAKQLALDDAIAPTTTARKPATRKRKAA